MKTIVFLTALTLLGSCGQTGSHNPGTLAEQPADSLPAPDVSMPGIGTDQGKPWQTDPGMPQAFAGLVKITTDFANSPGEKNLGSYNNLGYMLQSKLNKIIKHCHMQGEAHERLHLYLEILIPQIRAMQGGDLKACRQAFSNAVFILNSFPAYFQ